MDFRSLILIAQRNSQAALQNPSGKRKREEKAAGYSTKFEPPKKQAKQEKKISANVQRFLQSQEQKEKKTTGNQHHQQQVIVDGVESFESHEASQIYERLLNKFDSVASAPETNKTKHVSNKGSAVKLSSIKKDTTKSSGNVKEVATKPIEQSKTQEVVKESKHEKPKAARPALDFKALLQLAEQNKAAYGSAQSKGGPTRLLTEKEKRKLAEEKEKRKPTASTNPPRPTPKNSNLHHTPSSSSTLTKPDIPKNKPSKPNHSTDSRQFPPADVATAKPSRPVPLNYFTKQNPAKSHQPPMKRSKANRRRHIIDDNDSSDYDSDMDDFIDDDNAEEDYSAHIKEIFGYDKSRYRHVDDDDDDNNMMVSSFAQQMREEQISRKIGLMEDLEDMRAEEAAEAEKRKRRKEMLKQQKRSWWCIYIYIQILHNEIHIPRYEIYIFEFLITLIK